MSHLRYSGSISVCDSPACLTASLHLVAATNTTAPACSDLWLHSCGGWLAANPVPRSRSKWSVVLQLQAAATRQQARLVSQFSHEPSQVSTDLTWPC